ncbi:MAG: protein-L-isoaspartate(D-aspartate) O-methyltransferase [Pseudomonadota bacterium]
MGDENREALAAFLLRLRSKGITDHRLLSAFEEVPRRNFVPVIHITEAYAKGQMPIECGQSMTAVSRVAQVLSALEVQEEHRVLELGTGTGYQAALLGKLANKVLSVERFRTLQDKASNRLKQLGMENVIVKLMDGSEAQIDMGLSDRIVANFAFPEIPRKFIDNLASNGVMLAAVGDEGEQQVMKKFTKIGSRFQVEDLFPVRMQMMIPGIAKAI